MREVDQDAQLVAAPDQRLAGLGQARPGVGRARELERHAVAERVRPAPDQAERAQPGLVEDLERIQPRVDRLGALDVEDHRQHALLEAALELGPVRTTSSRPPEARSSRNSRAASAPVKRWARARLGVGGNGSS